MKSSETVIITVALSAILATGVWAEAHFAFGEYLESSSIVDLGLITANQDATVQVYEFSGGAMGELLGSADLHTGANPAVRFNLGTHPQQGVLVAILEGADVVAAKHFGVRDE